VIVHFLVQAIPTVKGTGVNWDLVGTLLGGVAAFLAVLGTFIGFIIKGVRNEITDSVTQLATVLDERLATKETVAQLTVTVAVLNTKVAVLESRFDGSR
jgi:hypothetical protein